MFDIIGSIINMGFKIGAPIKAAAEQFDSQGNLIDRSKAKNTAIVGSFFSPFTAFKTRSSYEGGWTDFSGNKYADYLEENEKERLRIVAEINAKEMKKKRTLMIIGAIVLLVIIYKVMK